MFKQALKITMGLATSLALVFSGAPRCIPTANLLSELVMLVSQDHQHSDGGHCEHEVNEEAEKLNTRQAILDRGEGCRCKVKTYLLADQSKTMTPEVAAPVSYEYEKQLPYYQPLYSLEKPGIDPPPPKHT